MYPLSQLTNKAASLASKPITTLFVAKDGTNVMKTRFFFPKDKVIITAAIHWWAFMA